MRLASPSTPPRSASGRDGPHGRVPVEVLATGTAVAGLAAAARIGWLDGLTIDAATLVGSVAVAAAVAMAALLAGRPGRWWAHTLPVVVGGVIVIESLAGWYLRAGVGVTDHYPRSFYLWIGLALAAPAVAVTRWRSLTAARRWAGAAAVPLTVAAAFLLINSHYGYWPTLGDLLGHPMTGQVTAGTLRRELASGGTAAATRPGATSGGSAGRSPHGWTDDRDERGRQVARAHRADAGRPVAPALDEADLTHPRPGQFAAVQIPAPVSHFVHRWDYVYLPPAYFSAARSRLGVLIMLAGTPSSPSIWASGGGAVATSNLYARHHDGLAPVLLFVDANGSWSGDTECVNGPRGQAETYLTTDVVRFAVDTLHLSADPDRWGVVGFSEGGTCAEDLALRHPTLFRHFVDLAGDAQPNVAGSTLRQLYGGSTSALHQHQPAWLLRQDRARYRDLTAWFGAGTGDPQHLRVAAHQDLAARRAGIRTQLLVGPDGHDWQFCTWALRRVLPGLAGQVEPPLTPRPPTAASPGAATAAGPRRLSTTPAGHPARPVTRRTGTAVATT